MDSKSDPILRLSEAVVNGVIFQLVDETALAPEKATPFAAGYDLYTPVDASFVEDKGDSYVVHQRIQIDTKIKVAIPKGYYARAAPRSGLALKNGLDTLAGVIDMDYRGHLIVILNRTSSTDPIPKFKRGDRIAQLVIEKIHEGDAIIIGPKDKLPDPGTRGAGAFGSTGR